MVKTIYMDEIIEKINEHPEDFREGRHLTPAQKALVAPEDMWRIDLIQELPEEVLRILDHICLPMHRWVSHYQNFQNKQWTEKQVYLLWQELKRKPTSEEIREDAKKNRNYERFNVYFPIRFPEETVFNCVKYNKHPELAGLYLAEASKADPEHKDYFGIIQENTTGISRHIRSG